MDNTLIQYKFNNGKLVRTVVVLDTNHDESHYNRYDMRCGICAREQTKIKYHCDQCLECFCTKYHRKNHSRLFHNEYSKRNKLIIWVESLKFI
jgi:hypothetical protein